MVEPDHNDEEALMRAAFARNREQLEGRFPAASGWAAPIARKRLEAAIAEAAKHQVVLDYSVASASGLNRLIESWEHMARVALDLEDDAWVGDHVAGVLDISALGAIYGELFVRHAGAAWTEAVGENGLEPAVARGAVVVLPIDTVRRRVFDGRQVDLASIFAREAAAMCKEAGQADQSNVPDRPRN